MLIDEKTTEAITYKMTAEELGQFLFSARSLDLPQGAKFSLQRNTGNGTDYYVLWVCAEHTNLYERELTL